MIEVVVKHAERAAAEIRTLTLVATNAQHLPSYSAGSHIDLHLPTGLVRQFSLCGDPASPEEYTIAVKREPESRGGSREVHDSVQVGDRLHISAPRNNFPLSTRAHSHILLAAGIGITPLLAMARALAAAQQPFHLHYFARSPEHAAFAEFLRSPTFQEHTSFHFGLDAAATAQQLVAVLAERRDECSAYICGPRPFIDAAKAAARNWPEEAVHVEHFTAATPAYDTDAEFTVRLARTGSSVQVARNESIVAALAREGVYIDTSCESGVCGTCITGVVDGTPDHRDEVLGPSEKAACTRVVPCVSRSRTAVLVLDL